MYFCIDTCRNVTSGKTIDEAFDDYQDLFAEDQFQQLKFYKAEEIKVELKEVTFTKTVITTTKKSSPKK